jgi:Fe-S-cluster formation regulator IscX/YfhJ
VPSKGDKYVIDEELQHTDHLFLGEVKETTDTAPTASFLDLYLEFDDSSQLSIKIYDKRDDFNFKTINFPNMCSNIPASPAYGGRNSANLELLIDKTSSIYLYVKLKALAS